MPLRKPLVLGSDGRLQQLQAADSLSSDNKRTLTAAATVIAGGPVYSSGASAFDLAQADDVDTSRVIGMAVAGITNAETGIIQTSGVLVLTTGEWDAVFGTTGGLAPDTTYYLSPGTAGLGTATCPVDVGDSIVILGIALSTTEFLVRISEPVLL